jgi:hypothetical protein
MGREKRVDKYKECSSGATKDRHDETLGAPSFPATSPAEITGYLPRLCLELSLAVG